MVTTHAGDLWAFGAIAVPIAVASLGLLLVVVGWLGRRRGDHVHCRKCGFDLHGSMGRGGARPARCPECGADLHGRRAVARGVRRRRWTVLVAGLVMVLASVGVLGAWGYASRSAVDLNAYKPVWLLRSEANRHGTASSAAALDELVRRLHAGKLSRPQVDGLVSDALAVQADQTRTWDADLGEIVEQANDLGMLAASDWASYVETAVRTGYSLDVRPRVGFGEPVYRWVRDEKPRLSDRTGGFKVDRIDPYVVLGGVPDSRSRSGRHRSGHHLDRSSGGGASGRGVAFDEAWAELPAGEHPIEFRSKVEVFQDRNRDGQADGPLIVSFELVLSGRVELTAESTVTPVVDASMREKVRSSLTVQRLRVRPKEDWDYISGSVELDRPPVGLAFEVFLRDSQGREVEFGRVNEGVHDKTSYHVGSKRPGWGEWTEPTATVVLRPSRESALHSHDVFEYWGEEVVFEGVPVELPPADVVAE